MAEYIERDALLQIIEQNVKLCHNRTRGVPFDSPLFGLNRSMASEYEAFALTVKSLPSADVVAVIRCKDCKYNPYNDEEDEIHCPMFGHYMTNEDFCSWGERKGA